MPDDFEISFEVDEIVRHSDESRRAGLNGQQKQIVYDTLVRTYGAAAGIATSTRLFGNANIGDLSKTNLQVAGQLASDQTYMILAIRCYLYFNGTNRRLFYLGTSSQLFWTLSVGDKPSFQAPTWYFPAGGGIYGFDSSTSVLSNGVPTHESILKLAKPIAVPVRQHFSALAEWFKTGTLDYLAGGTSLNTAATDDEKIIMFMMDGVQTRDVE